MVGRLPLRLPGFHDEEWVAVSSKWIRATFRRPASNAPTAFRTGPVEGRGGEVRDRPAGRLNIRGPERTASVLNLRAMEKGLKLTVVSEGSIPASLRTDSLRLRQVLLNIDVVSCAVSRGLARLLVGAYGIR